MKNKYLHSVMAGCLLIGCSGAFAADYSVVGKPVATISDPVLFGKCMVKIDSYSPTNDCPAPWISLDCSGDYYSKEDARRMWDSIQMGFALDVNTEIVVTDAEKHNGWCVAKRVALAK
jgi:hypothetical protein